MRIRCLILLLMLFTVTQAQARPPSDSDWNHFYDLQEDTGSIVNWDYGHEQMTMAMPLFPNPGSGLVLAIPADAWDVALQWQDHIPIYEGRLPISAVHEALERVLDAACLTQVYTFSCAFFYPSLGRADPLPERIRLQHDGLWSMALDAENPADLQAKIAAEKIDLPPQELKRIAHYADGKHCFVLVGVQSEADYQRVVGNDPPRAIWSSAQRLSCLQMAFPTPQPVLPARTAINPAGILEDNACVLGNVHLDHPTQWVTLQHFLGNQSKDEFTAPLQQPYTRILISYVPRELWLQPGAPAGTTRTEFYGRLLISWPMLLIMTALWTAFCSYISGGLSGLLIAKTWRGYARLGLWNLTTLVGLAIVLHRRRTLPPFQQLWRRRLYLIGFTAAFMLINCGADWLLMLALGKYWPMGAGPLWPYFGIGG